LLNKRVPTKNQLHHRGVVLSGTMLCSVRYGKGETINHLFYWVWFFVYSLWNLVLQWLSVFSVNPTDNGEQDLQFGVAHVFRKDIRSWF